jgi:hypothetical protein
MIRLAVFVLMASGLATAEPGVYPLQLPGLQALPAGRSRVHLWCRGVKLLGVLVSDEQGREASTRLKGGRCRRPFCCVTAAAGPREEAYPSGSWCR